MAQTINIRTSYDIQTSEFLFRKNIDKTLQHIKHESFLFIPQ